MRFPGHIYIGGMEIKVEEVDSAALSIAGDWNSWYCRIRINVDGTSESKRAEVFLHELLEAINHIGDLDLKHSTIVALSAFLFAAIRQNKLTFLP